MSEADEEIVLLEEMQKLLEGKIASLQRIVGIQAYLLQDLVQAVPPDIVSSENIKRILAISQRAIDLIAKESIDDERTN